MSDALRETCHEYYPDYPDSDGPYYVSNRQIAQALDDRPYAFSGRVYPIQPDAFPTSLELLDQRPSLDTLYATGVMPQDKSQGS